MEIDGDKRMLHARIHSAGHLLDTAFSNIGFSQLEPSKVRFALATLKSMHKTQEHIHHKNISEVVLLLINIFTHNFSGLTFVEM